MFFFILKEFQLSKVFRCKNEDGLTDSVTASRTAAIVVSHAFAPLSISTRSTRPPARVVVRAYGVA